MTIALRIIRSIPARDLIIAAGSTAMLWFVAAAISAILPGA